MTESKITELKPATVVADATNLMSRSVRTFEPIPKYRRYLRLIAPLPTVWCDALKTEAVEKVQGRVRR